MFDKIVARIEKRAAKLQGKGWGAHSVAAEVSQIVQLMEAERPSLCVDIGGNKGLYTEALLARFPDTEIRIFEPSSVNVDILRGKFRSLSNVTVEPFALSNEKGAASLYSEAAGSGLGSLTKRELDHIGLDFNVREDVQMIRFEDYWETALEKRTINLCKIDIEGHELDALMGFGKAIDHVDVVQFEFGGCNIDTRTYFRDFWYFFRDAGFDLYRISPFGPKRLAKYTERDEFFGTTNFIAKRVKT